MARLKSNMASPEQTAVASSACFVKNTFWFRYNFWSASFNRTFLVQAKAWTLRICTWNVTRGLICGSAEHSSNQVRLCSRVIRNDSYRYIKGRLLWLYTALSHRIRSFALNQFEFLITIWYDLLIFLMCLEWSSSVHKCVTRVTLLGWLYGLPAKSIAHARRVGRVSLPDTSHLRLSVRCMKWRWELSERPYIHAEFLIIFSSLICLTFINILFDPLLVVWLSYLRHLSLKMKVIQRSSVVFFFANFAKINLCFIMCDYKLDLQCSNVLVVTYNHILRCVISWGYLRDWKISETNVKSSCTFAVNCADSLTCILVGHSYFRYLSCMF
jgi:hypothetical protein